MKGPLSLLVAAALTTGLALAACGGDDSDSKNGTPSGDTAGTPASSPAATRPGGSAPAPASGSPGGTIPDDLKKLAADSAKATFTATYEYAQQGMKGTMTMAQDGKNSRIGLKTGDGEFVIITTEKDTFTCFKAGQTGLCQRQKPDPSMTALDFRDRLDDLEKEAGGIGFKKTDDRKVGGLDSACWESGAGGSQMTFCFAKKEKVLTLMEEKTTGMSFKLTDYSGKVDSKLFEPPFPVQ